MDTINSSFPCLLNGRDEVIKHIKDSYGLNKKLVLGEKRNQRTIHYKCSFPNCCFEIVYRSVKNEIISNSGDDYYELLPNQSFLKHSVSNSNGERGICGGLKTSMNTVIIVFYFVILYINLLVVCLMFYIFTLYM